MPKDPHAELLALLRQSAASFTRSFLVLAEAERTGNQAERQRALAAVQDLIGRAMALSDLLGRRRLLIEARAAEKRRPPGRREEPMLFGIGNGVRLGIERVVPEIPFEQAIEDLVRREPALAPSAAQVSELYRKRHAFALARSADRKITERVQQAVKEMAEKGVPASQAKTFVREAIGDYTEAYAETVYRTNLSTAYSAGRFRMATDPDVAKVIGGFEYNAILDSSVRHNHAAADGLIASQFDSIWEDFTPPLGYNCRCGLRLVDRWELEDEGLVKNGRVSRKVPSGFSSASPDKGFGGGRPDREVYKGGL